MEAQKIVTKAIYHQVLHHLCKNQDDLDEEGFVGLGGMISDVWGVAAPDAPIRSLLVDAIYAFTWVRSSYGWVREDRKKEQQKKLIQCFQHAPADFLAQAVVRLLDRAEYERSDGLRPDFELSNYL
jgi:hypothetical protein